MLFANVGICPFDMNKMINNIKGATLPDDERLHWVEKLPQASKEMLKNGELSDNFMDKLNIKNNMATNKDNLGSHRRRMSILNHHEYLRRQAIAAEEKEAEKIARQAAAEVRAENRRIKAAQPKRPRGRPLSTNETPVI